MANVPKSTGSKSLGKTIDPTASAVSKIVAEKPIAKSETVSLTAAQALKAADQAIGALATAKRKYVRNVPATPATPPPAALRDAGPVIAKATIAKPAIIETPVAPKAVPVIAPSIIAEEKTVEKAADVLAPATSPIAAYTEGKIIVTDIIENTKSYTEEAKTRFQTAFTDISAKTKAGVEKSTKAVEEIGDIAKGNVEAFVESGKIAAKGFETIGQDAAEYGRLSFEKATATLKSLAAVKSPTEFFQLQSELLSSAFDGFAKEAAKNSEAFLKLAGDVAQPISSRVALVTDKVKSLAA